MCTSRRYNESQRTSSGSPTSLVLPLPHQSVVDRTARCLLPAAGARHHRPAAHLPGGGASRRWCLATGGMSQFMYFRESKPKFLSPNSFSTMAEITPATCIVVEIPETRVRRVMRHHTNSRTVIQITRKCTTLELQSWSSISK